MGWNDHLEDDNELGNLPSEAFSPWNVDGPFEPQDHWLRTASEDEQKIAMRAWFLGRYCDPQRIPFITVKKVVISSSTVALTIRLTGFPTVLPEL